MPRETRTAMPIKALNTLHEGPTGYQILAAARTYHAAAAAALAKAEGTAELTVPRLLALQVLADGEPRSGADIARALLITSQSAAHAVGALERLGWIARSAGKGRKGHNAITTDGLAVLEAGTNALARVEACIHDTLADLFTSRQIAELSTLLTAACIGLAPPPEPATAQEHAQTAA